MDDAEFSGRRPGPDWARIAVAGMVVGGTIAPLWRAACASEAGLPLGFPTVSAASFPQA
jgi:hypothetical protein